MRDYQRSHRLLCQLFGVTPLVLTGSPLGNCTIFLSPSHSLIFHLPVSNINSISCWKLICTNAKEVLLLKKKSRKEKRQQVKYLIHTEARINYTHREARMLLQHFITTLVVQTEDELLCSSKWVTSKGRKLFCTDFDIPIFWFETWPKDEHGWFSFGKHRALMTCPTLWLTVMSAFLDSSDTKTKQCWKLCIFTISFCF